MGNYDRLPCGSWKKKYIYICDFFCDFLFNFIYFVNMHANLQTKRKNSTYVDYLSVDYLFNFISVSISIFIHLKIFGTNLWTHWIVLAMQSTAEMKWLRLVSTLQVIFIKGSFVTYISFIQNYFDKILKKNQINKYSMFDSFAQFDHHLKAQKKNSIKIISWLIFLDAKF